MDGSETVSIDGEFVVLNVGGFSLKHKHGIRILYEFPFPGIFRLFFSMFQPLVFDDFLFHSCFQEWDGVRVGEFLTQNIFLLGTLWMWLSFFEHFHSPFFRTFSTLQMKTVSFVIKRFQIYTAQILFQIHSVNVFWPTQPGNLKVPRSRSREIRCFWDV